MFRKIAIYTILFLAYLSPALLAQKNIEAFVLPDSVIEVLRRADSVRVMDSIQRSLLLFQLDQTKSTESLQKTRLLEKIQQLEMADSMRRVQRLEQLNRYKESAVGSALIPFGDTLFIYYLNIGPFSAKERALAAQDRILKIYEDRLFNADSLYLVHQNKSADLVYAGRLIISITDDDALWYSQDKYDLASNIRSKLIDSIERELKEHSLSYLMERLGLTLLILLALSVLIFFVFRYFKKIKTFIIAKEQPLLHYLRQKPIPIITPERLLSATELTLKFIRVLVIITILYLSLPLLFSLFPWTKGYAEVLIDWIIDPVKGVFTAIFSYLPNLLTILVILFFGRLGIKILAFLAGEIESEGLKIKGFYPDWAKPTYNVLRVLLYAFVFVVIFPYLPGSDSAVFQGVSIFLGILFSMGSSSAVANAVAGLVITYMRPFKEGDRVRIGDITGDIVEKSLLVTRIKTVKNEIITIPNSGVLSSHTMNFSTVQANSGVILHTTITIGYDVPWRKVHEALVQAAKSTNGILDHPKPFVLQKSLDDFYIAYEINGYTREVHHMSFIYSDLHANIQDVFAEHGIEIMSPHYRAMRDGEANTIPASDS
jgi:small-conductance mechanosensitive channel